jgi:hypothetical protein
MNKYRTPVLLSQRLNTLIVTEDKTTLEQELLNTNDLVNAINDKHLFRTHIVASIFIERYDLALNSLKKIREVCSGVDELTGMVYYTIEEYEKAFNSLDKISKYIFNDTSTLIKSLSDYECGNKQIYLHESNLEKVLPKSINANSFLGTLFYNRKKYLEASDYYVQSVILSKGSEFSRLNALRALYQLDFKSAIAQIPRFYLDTKSKLSKAQLDLELNKEKLGIIKINITPFHQVAKNLLYSDRLC